MNPVLAQLMQAIHGQAGLPMQLHGAPGGGIGGAAPAPLPPNAAPSPPAGPASSDRALAEHASNVLLAASAQAHDPALKASFSQALAALHKYIAMDQKEHEQALSGKMSPRLMAQKPAGRVLVGV